MNEELNLDDVLKKVIKDIGRYEETINRYMNDVPELLSANFLHLDESDFLNLQNEIEFYYKEILHFRNLLFDGFKEYLKHLKTKNNEDN